MTEAQSLNNPPSPKPRNNSAPRPFCVISIAVAAWILIIIGGYYVGKLYIDRSIEAVQQTNAVNVQAMQIQLDSMSNEIYQIQLALSDADQTLSNSGTTQEALNQKIEELDKQLQALAESLAILKEAP